MATLYDIFKFNNVPYSELTDERHKRIIDKMIEKLINDNYEKRLLDFKDQSGFGATFYIYDNLQNGYSYSYDTNLDINPALRQVVAGAFVYATNEPSE